MGGDREIANQRPALHCSPQALCTQQPLNIRAAYHKYTPVSASEAPKKNLPYRPFLILGMSNPAVSTRGAPAMVSSTVRLSEALRPHTLLGGDVLFQHEGTSDAERRIRATQVSSCAACLCIFPFPGGGTIRQTESLHAMVLAAGASMAASLSFCRLTDPARVP